MHQFYVAEFGRIGAKVNWDLAFCGYANDKKKQCKRPRKTTGTHSIETDSNLMWLSTTFLCYFSLLHTFSFEFFKLKHNCIVLVRTREFVQDFFLNQNTFFNTSMASRRMEYIYYNAMMTNAIGFVWIHIDRSFSPSFEGIWTNTQQIPWFLRFCFIFIFKFQCTDEKSSSDEFLFGCI